MTSWLSLLWIFLPASPPFITSLPLSQDEYIPWGTLRYLIGEAMYGGRVSDSYDRRILTTYLDEYLGDFLFDTFQPFHFHQSKDVDIAIPPIGGRDSYMEAIEGLPLVQSPEVFGLHANADISYYTDATKAIWVDLVDLQPRTGSTGTVGLFSGLNETLQNKCVVFNLQCLFCRV